MREAERFILWRIIGNDLPPRHDVGSVHDNLVFTLDNEPPLEGAERRWWLNRLVDDDQLVALTTALDRRNARYHIDPFDPARYRAADSRYEKVQAAIDINGARNAILHSPACHGAYVLPFDGGTFFTREAWSRVREDIGAAQSRGGSPECFAVPMVRVANRRDVFTTAAVPTAEPQIVFAPAHTLRFDERYRYGFRDKVSFLVALGRTPRYLEKGDVPLEERHVYDGDRTRCPDVGYVLRLPSAALDTRPLRRKERMLTREDAIDRFLGNVDARLGIVPSWTWGDLEKAADPMPDTCRRIAPNGSSTLPDGHRLPRSYGRGSDPIDFLFLDGTEPYEAVWDAFRRHEHELDGRAYIAVSNVDPHRRSKGGIRFMRDHVIGTRRYRPVRFENGTALIQRTGT